MRTRGWPIRGPATTTITTKTRPEPCTPSPCRILDVLSQPDAVPLPDFARPLRPRHPPRTDPAQAGRRAGTVLARFHFALRPRWRSAVAPHRRRAVAHRRQRGQAAAVVGGQRPAAEETRRTRTTRRAQARRPHPQAPEGRPGARTAAARVRAS